MWKTIALKSALRTLGVMIALGAAQAYSSGGGESFVLRPSTGPFAVDCAPPSTAQVNATASGASEAPRDEVEETPKHAIGSEQNAEDGEILRERSLESINEVGEDGLTPLLRAARDGNEEQVRWLIELGADVNQRDAELDRLTWVGRTALHWAAEAGHEGVVRLLVQEFRVDVNQGDGYGRTALHLAAMRGHEGAVRLLVQELGADVNQRDNQGQTALHCSVERDKERIVRLLVQELGVDVNQLNEYGQTSLDVAVSQIPGPENIVRMLINELGANIQQHHNGGPAALHWAAYGGHENIARMLINEYGADVQQRDNRGQTALHWAALGGQERMVRLLVNEFHVDFNQCDEKGRTALHVAAGIDQEGLPMLALGGHEKVVRLLVNEFHADLNQFDNNGETALHHAVRSEQEAMVRMLLEELHVDVNQLTADGRLPIGIAAFRGHLVLVQYLHRRGAQLTQADGRNLTPLDYAVLGGHLNVLDWIITTLIRAGFLNQLRSGNSVDWMGRIVTRYGQVFWDQLLGAEGLEFLNQVLARQSPDALIGILNDEQFNRLKQDLEGRNTALLHHLLIQIQAEFDVGSLFELESAVEGGREVVVRYLLEELGVPFEPDNPDDRQAMYAAAVRAQAFPQDSPEHWERREVWRLLAETLYDRSNTVGGDQHTPLTRAIVRSDAGSISELVEDLGADVNQADGEGFLPLTRAAVTPGLNAEAIVFLLNNEIDPADPNLLDPRGWTALTLAVAARNYLMVALLVRHRRIDVNQPNGHAETALLLAVNAADLKMIGILVCGGRLNIDQADEVGRTALYHAIARGDKRTALYLLERGANPDAADREGITPLHRAAFRAGFENDDEIFQRFLDRSHHRDQADRQGRTPAAWKKDGARERLELMQESEEEVEEEN